MELEERQPESESPSTFVGTIAEKLCAAARAATVFGDPVESVGVTVIPVARARWGFGGGVGRKKDENGAGGGGGVQVSPVGFIELKNGEAHFRPIGSLSFPWMIVGRLATLFVLGRVLAATGRK
jgi:uncharacterized spore protein YtfJ